MSLLLNAFEEPQESDVFVPCPIVWNGECGCCVTSPLPPSTDYESSKTKLHQ